jgi:hypothetical protein
MRMVIRMIAVNYVIAARLSLRNFMILTSCGARKTRAAAKSASTLRKGAIQRRRWLDLPADCRSLAGNDRLRRDVNRSCQTVSGNCLRSCRLAVSLAHVR